MAHTDYRTTAAIATVTKGAKFRCDGEIEIRGLKQRCNRVLAEVGDPSKTGGRHVVECRCGRRHTV